MANASQDDCHHLGCHHLGNCHGDLYRGVALFTFTIVIAAILESKMY